MLMILFMGKNLTWNLLSVFLCIPVSLSFSVGFGNGLKCLNLDIEAFFHDM